MIDSGMFFLGSKVSPMSSIQRDVKLGAGGCGSLTRVLPRTITPEANTKPTPVISKKKDFVSNKSEGEQGSRTPSASEESNQTTTPPENKAPRNGDSGVARPKNGLHASTNQRGSSKGTRRRSIFSQLRKEDDTDSNDDASAASEHTPSQDILEFSPPLDHRYELQKRFKLLDSFPLDKTQDLPPLPTPLLRYTNEGSATCGGVYPLVEPKSILRQGKFSPQSERSSSALSDEKGSTYSRSESVLSDVLELCSDTSMHGRKLCDFEEITRHMSLEESKQFFRETDSNASDRETLVKFDPRIVITEFPDDAERAWFTDDDLNRFKRETLILAQHYMMLHPEIAEEYNTSNIDPITGKVRKKALFALPGLCSADGLDSFGSSDEIERLLKNAVRKILIVDPNKSILHLFQKFMQEMFPDAHIVLVECGEEALRLYTAELKKQKHIWDGHNHGFDVVLVEERLNRQRMKPPMNSKQRIRHGFRLTRMRSDSSDYANSATALKPLEEKGIPKQDSEFNLQSLPKTNFEIPMSGSQLIQRIHEAEEQFYNQSQNTNERDSEALASEESSVFSPPQRWSLLIGVSVNVERDGQKLKDSGADLVWSKPPPTIGTSLRNQLISCLVSKRQKQALFCVKIPAG